MSKSKKETNLKLVKGSKADSSKVSALSPREIVSELDRYVIGQKEAKKAVAVALRNRWRRQALTDEMRDEVLPKNILMIGPTGVGKTEISRRLSRLAEAPFIKVEATRFTEVGYVGRDVEQIVRDLIDYKYVRIIDDFAFFSRLDKWTTFRLFNTPFFRWGCYIPIQHDSC